MNKGLGIRDKGMIGHQVAWAPGHPGCNVLILEMRRYRSAKVPKYLTHPKALATDP